MKSIAVAAVVILIVRILADTLIQTTLGMKADWHYFLPATVGEVFGCVVGVLLAILFVSERAMARRRTLFAATCTAAHSPTEGNNEIFVMTFAAFSDTKDAAEKEMRNRLERLYDPARYKHTMLVSEVGAVDPRAFILPTA